MRFKVMSEKEAQKFWKVVAAGFLIMVIAVVLSLGIVGMVLGPVGLNPGLTLQFALTLVFILGSVVVASFLVGWASIKIIRKR